MRVANRANLQNPLEPTPTGEKGKSTFSQSRASLVRGPKPPQLSAFSGTVADAPCRALSSALRDVVGLTQRLMR